MTKSDGRIARLDLDASSRIKGYRLSTEDESTPPGKILPLGVGGSSVVYKAYQVLDEERRIYVPRALKLFLMREDLAPSEAESSLVVASDNFFEEIGNISQVSHENLVQVTDAGEYEFEDAEGETRRLPYIVSHLVTGCTLKDVFDRNGSASRVIAEMREKPELAVSLVVQIARGLTYLHRKGMLHCDIAPKNIFIEDSSELRAVIGDVGMSRNVHAQAAGPVFIAGTRSYSPEEIREKIPGYVDSSFLVEWFTAWDIYGFSKTVVELLAFVEGIRPLPWVKAAAAKSRTAHAEYRSPKWRSPMDLAQQIEYCLPVHRQRFGIPELEPGAVIARKRMMPIAALSLTKRIDKLVSHPAIVRLHSVPQLTIVKSVSPGGNHTRYEHSLGVMENVRRMLSTLIDESSFLGILEKESVETGLVASLLYNAHRFPFSNIIHELNKRLPLGQDKIFADFAREGLLDEVFGERFVSHEGLCLEKTIERDFGNVDIAKLKRILVSGSILELSSPDEAALYTLLNSSLDARAIDFVRRDSLHLGLSSGDFFDLDDLLPHLKISTTSAGDNRVQVTLKSSGVPVAEQIIMMRYWLYQRVYWNQPNRAYNAAIRRALLDLRQVGSFESVLRARALHLGENQMFDLLYEFAKEHEQTSAVETLKLIKSNEKVLYREVFVRNLRQCENDPGLQDFSDLSRLISRDVSYLTMRDYEDALGEFLRDHLGLDRGGAPLVLLDTPFEPGNIKLGADIFVSSPSSSNPGSDDLRNLDKVSPIISGVNDNFTKDLHRLRILVRRDVRAEPEHAQRFYSELGHRLYAELRKLLQ